MAKILLKTNNQGKEDSKNSPNLRRMADSKNPPLRDIELFSISKLVMKFNHYIDCNEVRFERGTKSSNDNLLKQLHDEIDKQIIKNLSSLGQKIIDDLRDLQIEYSGSPKDIEEAKIDMTARLILNNVNFIIKKHFKDAGVELK